MTCATLTRHARRYLSKAAVTSILDEISKKRGGGNLSNCIVCDTVSSSCLGCREKWHGHFSWGIDFEVRSSCTRACTLMMRGALCASLQRASTAHSFFCKALFSIVRYISTTTMAESARFHVSLESLCATGHRRLLRCEAPAHVLGRAVVRRSAPRRVVRKVTRDFRAA